MDPNYGPRERLQYRRLHKRVQGGKVIEVPLKKRQYRKLAETLPVSALHPLRLGLWHLAPPKKALALRRRLHISS